jgi:pimeloyl-ACP methyl ester carboxylesterase
LKDEIAAGHDRHCRRNRELAMTTRPVIPIFLALALASLLGGCAFTPYRTSGEPCTIDRPQSNDKGNFDWEATADGQRPCANRWQVQVTKPVPFSMNFVEIDEQGMLASRAQAEAAIANASIDEGDGSYVVVFVHGWHHNASSTDGNVQGFYDALALSSRWNKSRKIKGIYVGWRGDSLPLPGLRYLTFWDRKNTSDEVGRGGLLEFLLRLEHGVKNGANGKNRLLLVGHSFGASVTFNALAHTYMQRFMEGAHSQDNKPRFRGYGDLVVLVNPAIEAMRYMPFQSAIEYYSQRTAPPRVDFSFETRPVLVILSSQGDAATRIAFPGARFFTTALEAHSRISADRGVTPDGQYSEWVLDRDTVGNFDGFQTHDPLRLSANAADPNITIAAKLTEQCDALDGTKLWRLLNQTAGDAAFPDSQVFMRRRPDAKVLNSPYIVAAVNRELIRDHTDIGRPNVVCWINQLLDTKETGVRTLAEIEYDHEIQRLER